jgi:hypothetical protein
MESLVSWLLIIPFLTSSLAKDSAATELGESTSGAGRLVVPVQMKCSQYRPATPTQWGGGEYYVTQRHLVGNFAIEGVHAEYC